MFRTKKESAAEEPRGATLGQIFVSFAKVGAVLFGGGYAMLPLLEREVVDKRGWCRLGEMTDYYAMSQLVPGVVAINTAMLIGHHLRGFWGTVAATAGVVFAPFFVILAYALAFDQMAGSTLLADAMSGLRPAVAGLMLGVAYTLFSRSRKTRVGLAVSVLVTVLVLGCGVSAVRVILAGVAAGVGWYAVSLVRSTREGGHLDPPLRPTPPNPEP
jgi:chromate transporter